MNKLQYLMSLLMEEASEVSQAANKCNRFTPEHVYEAYGNSNLERLQIEITDFMTVLNMIEEELKTEFSKEPSQAKRERIELYMHASRLMGTLHD
jgi:NTP pyrophosphatase (non-canonical NTP hydrolase)